jgi:hypothetical protein
MSSMDWLRWIDFCLIWGAAALAYEWLVPHHHAFLEILCSLVVYAIHVSLVRGRGAK